MEICRTFITWKVILLQRLLWHYRGTETLANDCLCKVETKLSKFAVGSQQCNITCQASNSMWNTLPSLANNNASFFLLIWFFPKYYLLFFWHWLYYYHHNSLVVIDEVSLVHSRWKESSFDDVFFLSVVWIHFDMCNLYKTSGKRNESFKQNIPSKLTFTL